MRRIDRKSSTSRTARERVSARIGLLGRSAEAWAGVLVLAVVLLAPRGWTTSGQAALGNWADDILDLLEQIEQHLTDAWVAIGQNQGPLSEPELSQVAGDLDAVLALIDQIQDGGTYPSLDPPDIGSVDPAYDPDTLPRYASDTRAMAGDAVDEIQSRVVDHKVIGTHLKTIEELITRATPHNYRTKAGIDTGE